MASVKVAVRVRPMNKREIDMRSTFIISMDGPKTYITNVKLPVTTVVDTLGRERIKQFTYDHSYWSVEQADHNYTSQEKVFEDLGYDVVQAAYEGYNACVFAYGQTGSGKTYTMMGNPDDHGLIPRICHSLFGHLEDGETTYRCEVSYLEIYNERVRDLLRENKGEPPNLRVREHPKEGPYVQDLSKHLVMNYQDIEKLIIRGNENRTTAATNMNDMSSRSHAIFTIVFTQAKFIDEIPSEIHSKIHLVDLAGSERVDASGVTGQRLKEGGSINKSLVTLGKIISTLADLSDKISGQRNKVFIPYRDSVLTYLLQDSLGGNSKTIMIATISPADCNYAETLSTLRYASRAKRIINIPKVNEDPNVKLIRELREENATLKALLGQNVDFLANAEKLCANEEKVKRLTEKWTGKWQEACSILEEHKTLALRKDGIGVVLDSELPYLLALHDDILSTGMKLYHLKEKETRVGRADAEIQQDIVLVGLYIESEHCVVQHHNGEVTLVPLEGAMCSVNNSRVHEPTKLSQGAVLRLGREHLFRFNNPIEAARMREELRMSGRNHMLKVSHDFQWTWSNLSINDSALGSEWDIDQKLGGILGQDEHEKLEEKRRQIEALEREHCLAEAQRLAQLAEQEGNRVELEEREEELKKLQSDAECMKDKAEKAQKEIKRLSANFEQHFEEAIKEQERIVDEQERVQAEKERLEHEKQRARAERQRLRKIREKEKAKIELEKERQLEEWAELNNQRRQIAVQRLKEQEELEKEKKSAEQRMKQEKTVEKEVYLQAVADMRSLIETEVKEIRRLSGLPLSPDLELTSTSITTPSLSSQEERMEDSLEEEEEEEEEAPEDGASLSISDRSISNGVLPNATSTPESTKVFRSTKVFQLLPSGVDQMNEPVKEGPVLPAKYLEGSPVNELPRALPTGLGMEDSFTDHLAEIVVAEVNMMSSTTDSMASSLLGSSLGDSLTEKMSEGSTGSMEEIVNMLQHLSIKVGDIHQKVCQSLQRKYTSILSSDDTTAGLGSEVISQFSHIRPLFDELERLASQAHEAGEQNKVPERLEDYDRTLTIVDQFLRIHEAIQAIVMGIKQRHFLEVVENLDIVNALLGEVEIETDLDSEVYKVLQTEVCIQREQLYFQLGETWNDLIRWKLPNDCKRNVNQPRSVSLEISMQDDLKDVLTQMLQSMQAVHMINVRIKMLCDRVMVHFVESIVKDRNTLIQVVSDDNNCMLCVVQYPSQGQGQAEAQHMGQLVPPCEVFPKLEQIFIFLHRPLNEVTIEECIDSEDGTLKQSMAFVQKIGKEICPRLFDYIFNECLCHSMPRGNRNLDKFNEAITLTEKFQDLLMSLNFMPMDQSSLMDYFNNVNSLFANMKSQEVLRRAHELMTKDLQSSLQVSSEHPLGTLKDTRRIPIGINISDSLIEFVKSCRDDVAAGNQRIPTCQISLPVRGLLVLAYDTLRDAISGSPDTAMHLSYSLHNTFELFCEVIPSYHREKLTNMPLLAALHHNNCMFVAHHIQVMDRHFRKKMALSANPSRHANLGELVPKVRKLGNDNFTQHIILKKEQLCDHLVAAEGFECVADDDGESAREAVIQMLHHLRHIGATWQDVLPTKVYCKALGTLMNAAVVDMVDNVLAIGEFSVDDCDVLQGVFRHITDVAPQLFTLPDMQDNPEVTLHEFVPNWMKFRELLLVLRSNLQQVADRWADGKGPLALYFSPEEVKRLVVAMFENTSKRDAVLGQLR